MKDLVGEEGVLCKLKVESKARVDSREKIDCDVLDKGKHRDVLLVDALLVIVMETGDTHDTRGREEFKKKNPPQKKR